jgi:hypothetical protein
MGPHPGQGGLGPACGSTDKVENVDMQRNNGRGSYDWSTAS